MLLVNNESSIQNMMIYCQRTPADAPCCRHFWLNMENVMHSLEKFLQMSLVVDTPSFISRM
jgi:hypothetical protein